MYLEMILSTWTTMRWRVGEVNEACPPGGQQNTRKRNRKQLSSLYISPDETELAEFALIGHTCCHVMLEPVSPDIRNVTWLSVRQWVEGRGVLNSQRVGGDIRVCLNSSPGKERSCTSQFQDKLNIRYSGL